MMTTLEKELRRVTGDNVVVHDDGTVGWLDPATGAGGYFGVYDDPDAIAAEIAGLPDWDSCTVDWSDLGIPRFDR